MQMKLIKGNFKVTNFQIEIGMSQTIIMNHNEAGGLRSISSQAERRHERKELHRKPPLPR